MKLLAIIGSPRKKGNSSTVIQEFGEAMRKVENELTVDYFFLSDLNLDYCKGCCACIFRGDEFCPQKTQVAAIIEQMETHDGIIFASPVYAHQITALMKNLMDHLSFLFHRPRFFDKPAIVLATTDGSGLRETLKYLKFTAMGWGFQITGQLGVISTIFKINEKYRAKMGNQIDKIAQRTLKMMKTGRRAKVTLQEMLFFRAMRQKAGYIPCDRAYWETKGWFAKDYFVDLPLNPCKNFIAGVMESLLKTLSMIMFKKYLAKGESPEPE